MTDEGVRIRLLGPVAVEGATEEPVGPRLRRLLAALALESGMQVSESSLIDVVWGDDGDLPANPARSLQTHISRLRSLLGAEAIERSGAGYRLVAGHVWLDTTEFEQRLEAARAARGDADDRSAIGALEDALSLWAGDAVSEFASEMWATAGARRLDELRVDAQEQRAELLVALDDVDGSLIADLERLAGEHPHRDGPTRQLMIALHRSGRQADALAAFSRHRARLADLGLEPSAGLTQLESQILTDDPAVAGSALATGQREDEAGAAGETDLAGFVAASAGAALPVPTVLALIEPVAENLDQLHARRPAEVHGAVMPENIMVTADGRSLLVADRTGDRLRSPGFCAPEVMADEALTPAADIYSLSAVAVFLLTGVVPESGAAWPAALSAAGLGRLERVLRHGLAWDSLARPGSASDFVHRLREAAQTDLPTGTVTLVLFETPATMGEGRAGARREALEAAGGRLPGTVSLPPMCSMAVFPRAGDAASAAMAIAAEGEPAIAVHAGDLGGWRGATLQQLADEAIALRTGAAPSTIVCSPPIRMLLGADDSLEFDPAPNGLRMRRARQGEAGKGATSTPSGHGLRSDHATAWITARRARPLAGRVDEMQSSLASIERGRTAGEAPMVVLIGEAGMGKTRLLAEIAAHAGEQGERVLVGRCTESGGAFEPFLDALGDTSFPFESGQLERDEEGWMDRRRFFRRIADSLRDVGGPLTLVLDDVQWIDASSAALLAQLLDDLPDTLAVIAGCRPSENRRILDEVIQHPGATVLPVGPLGISEISHLAESAGLALPAQTVDDLHTLTGGSPFFGLQLLNHLRDVPGHTLGPSDMPVGVRDWILRRVDGLGDAARETLAPAAVIGRSFEVVVLADVRGVTPLEALTHLDAAADAGLLVEGAHPGEFRFVHAIVTTTLEESLSAGRRALLHAAIAKRIEEDGADFERLEAALHHWFEADRLGDPLHTGEIAAEVATRTTERLAHEQAASIVDRALALLEGAAATKERDRVEAVLRVAHGRADFIASRNQQAIAHLYRAVDLAETGEDPSTLAEAALLASLNRRHGLEDPELFRILERATEVCPPEPAVLRAMLHVRRARLLPAKVAHEERTAMARLALVDLDLMEPVDRATVETEVARACWSPDDAKERERLTTRCINEALHHRAQGGESRWTGVLIESLNHRAAALVQLGEPVRGLDDADHAARLADDAGTTFLLTRIMMGQAMIHTTLGHYEEAERLSHDAVSMSGRHNLQLAQMSIGYSIGRDRGEQAQLAMLEKQLGDLVDQNPVVVAAFAVIHAEIGQIDDARRLLHSLRQLAPWPRNWLWLATTVAALEASILTGETEMARRYAAVLTRYSGLWALAGAELACWGPVDRVLGLQHLACGRHDEARRSLRAALDSAVSQGATPWVTRCQEGLDAVPAGSA